MKKSIITLLIITSFLGAQDLSLTNYRWRHDEASMHKFHFTYNAGFNIPMHAYAEKRFHINEYVDMAYGVVLSSENDIGATSIRPDFPVFSTARFYLGELNFNYKNLNLSIGRHLQNVDPVEQKTIWNKNRLTGDGIFWSWNFLENWRFENSLEFLPSEKLSREEVFERILNYHAVIWEYKRFTFLIGEISLYTGINRGVSLQRSNPFLPYALRMIDSHDKHLPGFLADDENYIILAGLEFKILESLSIKSYFYLDDIQIDKQDRERVSDNYLLYNELNFNLDENFRFSVQFSLSDLAMGWHQGPFTSFASYGYELLPHAFGETYSGSININYKHKFFEIYVSGFTSKKALIDPYNDYDQLHYLYLHEIQDNLDKIIVSGLDIKTGFYIFKNLALWGHVRLETHESPVYNLILQTHF
jgi:hypothetical protein